MENDMKKYSPLVAVSLFALIAASPVLADANTNTSNIDQIGANLTATATQGGLGNTSLSNIDQGLLSPGDNLVATVTQDGVGTVNEAHILQDDEDNTGSIDQSGLVVDNYALIDQDGVNNEATIIQDGVGTDNDVEVTQVGTGALNTATVNQGGIANTNVAGVGQNGSNLSATVTQN
jgi:hypothetical protein